MAAVLRLAGWDSESDVVQALECFQVIVRVVSALAARDDQRCYQLFQQLQAQRYYQCGAMRACRMLLNWRDKSWTSGSGALRFHTGQPFLRLVVTPCRRAAVTQAAGNGARGMP